MAPATVRHYPPRLYVPGTRILLLTEARKMPCNSWSLPARASCPFSVHHTPGAICDWCYADAGNYRRYPNVKRAQHARFAWARACMKSAAGRLEFVETLSHAIDLATRSTERRTRENLFRGHDSGDFFSPIYTRTWGDIARNLPHVRIWFPTKSHRALTMDSPMAEYWREAFAWLNSAPNVIVRPSADYFNQPAPRVRGFAAGSTAVDVAPTCLAHTRKHRCGPCRRCWSQPRVPVAYRRHK